MPAPPSPGPRPSPTGNSPSSPSSPMPPTPTFDPLQYRKDELPAKLSLHSEVVSDPIGMEILVHNVSHSDMVLAIGVQSGVPGSRVTTTFLCRPKFSFFNSISETVFKRTREMLEKHRSLGSGAALRCLARCPSHRRLTNKPRLPLSEICGGMVYVGFDLEGGDSTISLSEDELTQFKFKQDTARTTLKMSMAAAASDDEMESCGGGRPVITAVYFPLLGVLLSKWKKVMNEHGVAADDHSTQKTLVLTSGVGLPRNVSDTVHGNSTGVTAQIIALFVGLVHADVSVVPIHSEKDIFRYDDNIDYVNQDLLPLIERWRREIVAIHKENWSSRFHVTCSFGGGSPARVSAITASLRSFRPSCLHIWQLKTFWHARTVSEDDVEFHTADEIDTVPLVLVVDTDDQTKMVAREMIRHRRDFERIRDHLNHDLRDFWLRKTRKPVLSVLLVQKSGHPPALFRGMNMEVSMPTGSLCAERNVIGTALASDPTIRRQDLKIVAVLSVSLELGDRKHGIPSPSPFGNVEPTSRKPKQGVIDSWIASAWTKTVQASSDIDSGAGSANGSDERSGSLPPPSPLSLPQLRPGNSNHGSGEERKPDLSPLKLDKYEHSSPGSQRRATWRSEPQSPRLKRLRSISGSFDDSHRERGLNPLMPCGACNEWLKKIAEVNPDFKVVTFTDVTCDGVYIHHVQTM